MIFYFFRLGYTITKEVRYLNYPYEETGKRVLQLRKERGYTREKLAELADISVQFLADIEKGRKNMTVTTLRKLSNALLVTTDRIVNGEEKTSDEIDNELNDLCKMLSPAMQHKAAKLLRLFIESINN